LTIVSHLASILSPDARTEVSTSTKLSGDIFGAVTGIPSGWFYQSSLQKKKNYKRSPEGRMVYTTKAARQHRMFYNQSQKETLLAWFEHNPHPNKSTKEQLGKQLGIPASKIKVGFRLVLSESKAWLSLFRQFSLLRQDIVKKGFPVHTTIKNKNKNSAYM
jgi:hypothetical protein